MKHTITFFAVMMMALAISQSVKAYDFSAVSPSGHTLYYKINMGKAEVTHQLSYSTSPGYPNLTGDLEIPSTVTNGSNTYSVTSIGSYAFLDCAGLTSVIIPNSVTSIGTSAFHGCMGMTWVIIGNSVTRIDGSAFTGCNGLTSLTIPNSVTIIGAFAFSSCVELGSITIPNTVASIGTNAFASVRHINYYGNATGAPWGAISMNGTTDGEFAFTDTTKHFLMAYIGLGGEVTVPSTVDTIGEKAFYYCRALTSVTISNSVISIGDYAFYGCSGLTSLTIGESVSSIGVGAFLNVSINIGDTIFVLAEVPPTITSSTFSSTPKGVSVRVPCGSVEAYHQAPYWSEFTNISDANGSSVGIGEIKVSNAKIYSANGQIVVEGADGNTVTLYDVSGRKLVTKRDDYMPLLLDVPASGTYMVKIGDYPARRVVVIK